MNTFIITSTVNATYGLVDNETRYQQTLETIQSIRDKVPDAKIVLVDSSTEQFDNEKFKELKTKTDLFITLFNHYSAVEFNQNQQKSAGECYIMTIALMAISEMGLVGNRVFKISGRYKLSDSIDIKEYDNPELEGKYVFKRRVQSWMNRETSLVDTRLWSFSGSLLQETKDMLPKVMDIVLGGTFDLEHAYFQKLDLNNLVEFDKMHLEGQIASDGRIQYD